MVGITRNRRIITLALAVATKNQADIPRLIADRSNRTTAMCYPLGHKSYFNNGSGLSREAESWAAFTKYFALTSMFDLSDCNVLFSIFLLNV